MGRTPAYHHVGTVLMLVAMVFMLVVCISAPLINDLYMLEATVADGSPEKDFANATIKAGVFGYCIGSSCTSPKIAYDQSLLSHNGTLQLDGIFVPSLTYGLVMNPIAAGFSFLAFLFAFGGQSIWGSIATFFSLWSLILTTVALGIDFAVFGIAADRFNHSGQIAQGSVYFGRGMWLVIAAMACQLLATLIICCSRRSIRKQKANEKSNLPLSRQDTRSSSASNIPLTAEKASSHFRRRSNSTSERH